jgi:two-component system cell cycle sensor histidine kinase/response regulator CckA
MYSGRLSWGRGLSAVKADSKQKAEPEPYQGGQRPTDDLFGQFVRHTPAAVAMLDRDLCYLLVSDRWLTDYHLEQTDIIGRSHYEIFPESPPRWRAIHQRCLAGAVERCEEDWFTRQDGTVEWLQWEVRPWYAADGAIGGISMFTQVITERKRVSEALAASERRFRSALQNSPIGMALVAPDGRFLVVNPALCRITGYSADELAATTFQALTYPDDLGADEALVAQVLSREIETYTLEKRYRHKRGSWVWAQLNVSVEWNPDGTPSHFISQIQDITDRKRIEDQLRQSQKMEAIGQLAGGVAHDFNNVLAAIMMQSELAAVTKGVPADVVELLADIRGAAGRAAGLTRQLLQFSRLEVIQPRRLDLNDQVRSLSRMLSRVLLSDIHVRVELGAGPLWVHADAGMIDQVLMNLSVNARDAMPAGGLLVIRTVAVDFAPGAPFPAPDMAPGSYICLSVSDEGTGISDHDLPRIFEPFFTTKGPGKGTGLGLPTVFGIVKQHQGAIAVDSEVGKGTTFRVYLPVGTGEELARPGVGDQLGVCGGDETVLLVEDDPILGPLSRTALEGWGYEVLQASNATEALRIFDDHHGLIDLLVTDLVMPGLQGRDLASQLQRAARAADPADDGLQPRARRARARPRASPVLPPQALRPRGARAGRPGLPR